MMRKICCVIVTFNNCEMLACLLEDLQRQTLLPAQVIVVDNASRDRTAATVARVYPRAEYVRFERNRGSAGGYREGIRRACGQNQLVWLLDDDVALEPESLERLVAGLEGLEKGHKVGAVRSWCTPRAGFTVPRRTSSFAWRGTLIAKETVETIGLPQEDFFLYADDVEYSLRMSRKGYELYWIPGSRVIERRSTDRQGRGPVSLYRESARSYYAFRNETRVFLMYAKPFRLLRTWLSAVKATLFLLLASDGAERIAAIWRGLCDGIAGVRGPCAAYTLSGDKQ